MSVRARRKAQEGIRAMGTVKQLHAYGSHSSWTEYRDALARFAPFKTSGSLFGAPAEDLFPAYTTVGGRPVAGQLPEPWLSEFRADGSISYVVYSYSTPVAWYSEIQCKWVIPDVRYSVTTSGHQGTVRTAISQIGSE